MPTNVVNWTETVKNQPTSWLFAKVGDVELRSTQHKIIL